MRERVSSDQVIGRVPQDVFGGRAQVEDDPLGGSQTGEVLRVFGQGAELRFAAVGIVLGALAFADLLEQRAVHEGQFGGALVHPVLEFLVRALQGFRDRAADGDVLDGALVSDDAPGSVADRAGILRDPQTRAIGTPDFRFYPDDHALRFEPPLEFRATARADVHGVQVLERRDEGFRVRVTEEMGERRVDVEETARAGQRLVNPADGVLEQGLVTRLGVRQRGGMLVDAGLEFIAVGAHRLVRLAAAVDFALVAGGVPAQFQFGDDDGGQVFEHGGLARPEFPRHGVRDAERTQAETARGGERCARVEADKRFTDHERMVGEPFIQTRIRHDHAAGFQDGVCAERLAARRLFDIEPEPRLEPLPVAVHQRNQGDGSMENLRRETRDPVEGGFRRACPSRRSRKAQKDDPLRRGAGVPT